MAAILAFAQHRAFDPEATRLMAAAFESAWEQLNDMGRVPTASSTATRDMLAKRILEAAQRGVRDPDLLRHEALVSVTEAGQRRQAPR